MKRNKDNSKSSWKQLDLPFNSFDLLEKNSTTPDDNVICLASKINERSIKIEESTRKKSINRLIQYAENLNW